MRILYSDGRLVRAGDFRRAFERLFRVGSPGIDGYSRIVDAAACTRRPSRCDLTRGIVTDDATGSVVFHLREPDPDFLYALTSFAFSAPVPPGTADPGAGVALPPGTGPYRIGAASAREVRFVRNRFFHEWSHTAQPDGNPDAIVWRSAPSHAAVVDSVERGDADWTFDLIGPDRLGALRRRVPAQVHENPWFLVEFAHLNTKRPPFDDLRVRQALNYAIDPARVVDMYGGASVATATCQPLAPGIPGYTRYCPYTRRPARDGGWRAPDLARARRLVAASGTRRTPVTVWAITNQLAVPSELPGYVAGVLRRLGFRATVRRAPSASLTPAIRARHQLSVDGDWLPDYPAASAYIPQFFACGGTHSNGYFCDHRLDRQMARARADQLGDPRRAAARWMQVDHELVDQAAWVPLVNLRGVDLVSERLRNFEFHPVWGFIADQAWLRCYRPPDPNDGGRRRARRTTFPPPQAGAWSSTAPPSIRRGSHLKQLTPFKPSSTPTAPALTAVEDLPLPDGIYNQFPIAHGKVPRIDDFAERGKALVAGGPRRAISDDTPGHATPKQPHIGRPPHNDPRASGRDVREAVAHYRERFGFDAPHETDAFAVLVRHDAVLHSGARAMRTGARGRT